MLRRDATPTHFSMIQTGPDKESVSGVGGQVKVFTGSGTLLVGDVVYFSAANTVAKVAVTATYVSFAGVVVGGRSTRMQALLHSDDLGATAALTGEEVLVQVDGIANVTISAAVVITNSLVASAATAGRVTPGTTANQVLGTPITTGTTNGDKIKMIIRHR
jgi:hypothetical protein